MSLLSRNREIQTASLKLKALKIEDTDRMFEIYSDAQVMKYWSRPPVSDHAGAQEIVQQDIDSDARGDSITWSITLKSTSELIGKCIVFNYSEANRRAETGYILRRSLWRQGLMSEAMTAVIDFAFGNLDLYRLEADTDSQNTASLRLLEKLGFQREGLFRDRWLVNGQWQDSVMFGLLKPDWDRRDSTGKKTRQRPE
jgi:RimJ/RimL family protein N-acetyltransferase